MESLVGPQSARPDLLSDVVATGLPACRTAAMALLILAFSQGTGMDACPYSVAVRVESQTPSVPDGLPLVGGFTQILFNPTDLHFRPFTFLEQVHHPSQVLLIHF
jgi:hypothetical protein